jgi:hypothetical protein
MMMLKFIIRGRWDNISKTESLDADAVAVPRFERPLPKAALWPLYRRVASGAANVRRPANDSLTASRAPDLPVC